VADPALRGKDAQKRSRVCLCLVRELAAQPLAKRAKRPHSKFSDRKALDGPAMRPGTPLAVENGVGKPAAAERRDKKRA
jgi:hypothetical protein